MIYLHAPSLSLPQQLGIRYTDAFLLFGLKSILTQAPLMTLRMRLHSIQAFTNALDRLRLRLNQNKMSKTYIY